MSDPFTVHGSFCDGILPCLGNSLGRHRVTGTNSIRKANISSASATHPTCAYKNEFVHFFDFHAFVCHTTVTPVHVSRSSGAVVVWSLLHLFPHVFSLGGDASIVSTVRGCASAYSVNSVARSLADKGTSSSGL